MPKRQYHVILTDEEHKKLLAIVSKGTKSAKAIMHANVLLAANEARKGGKMIDDDIAELHHINRQTVQTIRRTYCEKGFDSAIKRKKRETPPVEPKITGEVEARIIALCCSTPPEGRAKWSLRLLADKSVELHIVDSISHEAVSRLLKKRIEATST